MKYIFTLLNRAAEQEQQSSVGVAKRDFLTATTTATRTTATRTRRSRRGRTARYASIHSPNVLPMPNADADQSRVSTAASQSQQASPWQRQRNRNRSSPDVDSRSRRSRETLSGRAAPPYLPPPRGRTREYCKVFRVAFFFGIFCAKSVRHNFQIPQSVASCGRQRYGTEKKFEKKY